MRGEDNWFHDGISRDVELKDLGVEQDEMVKPLQGDVLTELVSLCDPTTDLVDCTNGLGDSRLLSFWQRASTSIERLRHEYVATVQATNPTTSLTI